MEASDLVGIPFQDVGRDYTGADCYGIFYLFYRDVLGIELPRLDDYDQVEDKEGVNRLVCQETQQWVPVPKSGETIHDGILLRSTTSGHHIGVIVQPGKMLHSTRQRGESVIERYNSLWWRHRIIGFYRYQLRQ